MNKKTANGFAVLSLLVVLAATASVALRVAAADTAGRRSAAADFERLSALVAPARGPADLADPKLRASLEAHYRSSPSLLLATVYERGAGVRWRIPSRSEYLPAVENARPLPETRYPPRSSLLLAEPVPGDKSGRLVIEALYATLPQATVFAAFRDATLGIAAYLALAALAFLVAGLAKGASGSKARRDRPPETTGSPAETTAEDDPDADYAADVQTSFIDEEACPDEPSLGPGCEPYSPLADEDFAIPDLDAEVAPRSPAPGPAASAPSAAPAGLYSPISGLGWESYLNDRLDAELARSASFEQDLSLLVFACEGLSPGGAEYGLVAKAIADFFSFKDLSFERGPEGFAIVLPNIDADHGLRMAEEFLKKLAGLFKEVRESPAAPPAFIGLSSRAGRLVDAARVTQEAEAALKKAREDRDSQIVAFRPDPDKYRLYLASKGC